PPSPSPAPVPVPAQAAAPRGRTAAAPVAPTAFKNVRLVVVMDPPGSAGPTLSRVRPRVHSRTGNGRSGFRRGLAHASTPDKKVCTMQRARIIGTGGFAPPRVVTNADMAKIVDTSDEWIRTRTGIRE